MTATFQDAVNDNLLSFISYMLWILKFYAIITLIWMKRALSDISDTVFLHDHGTLLLALFNFNPSMDK